jgi:hypothetical protein
MRYIPQSKYTFDEICEQCRAAINRPVSDTQERTDVYAEVRKFYRYNENAKFWSYDAPVFNMKDYGSLIH